MRRDEYSNCASKAETKRWSDRPPSAEIIKRIETTNTTQAFILFFVNRVLPGIPRLVTDKVTGVAGRRDAGNRSCSAGGQGVQARATQVQDMQHTSSPSDEKVKMGSRKQSVLRSIKVRVLRCDNPDLLVPGKSCLTVGAELPNLNAFVSFFSLFRMVLILSNNFLATYLFGPRKFLSYFPTGVCDVNHPFARSLLTTQLIALSPLSTRCSQLTDTTMSHIKPGDLPTGRRLGVTFTVYEGVGGGARAVLPLTQSAVFSEKCGTIMSSFRRRRGGPVNNEACSGYS